MAGYFVTPTIDFRFDHEAGPMPRLLKERKARGLAPPAKLVAHGVGFLHRTKQIAAPYIFRFLRCPFVCRVWHRRSQNQGLGNSSQPPTPLAN